MTARTPGKPKFAPRVVAVPVDEPDEPDAEGDGSAARIVTRPDGFHWVSADGCNEFGPFRTWEDAQADMDSGDEELGTEPGGLLHAAEDEIGIADWIDPDTGEPAEGHSPPHLQDE